MPVELLLDRLERRLGKFAIPGIIRIVVAFNALTFGMLQINPYFYKVLTLDSTSVLQGQVWRLFTYVFIPAGPIGGGPPTASTFLMVCIALLFLWFIGDSLEATWGSFRLTLFYVVGMAGCTIAAFFFGGESTNFFLNLSLLFAFATLFPNHQVLFMFIIPVQVKWIGLLSLVGVAFAFLGGNLGTKAAIVISFSNYLLFFGPSLLQNWKQRADVSQRRQKFDAAAAVDTEPLNKCATCGRTDASHPELHFRVGPDGQDYCEEHLPPDSVRP